jgi:hypothetical protein
MPSSPRCAGRASTRVFVDTNILFSALLFPSGVAACAFARML